MLGVAIFIVLALSTVEVIGFRTDLEELVRRNGENSALILSILKGDLYGVDGLLRDYGADPSYRENSPLAVAYQRGYRDIVDRIVSDTRFDRRRGDDFAIYLAASAGDSDLLRRLLSFEDANPGTRDNLPLIAALQEGHPDTALILIEDWRVDPSVKQCKPVFIAAQVGMFDHVSRMLLDPRVDLHLVAKWARQLTSFNAKRAIGIPLMRSMLMVPISSGRFPIEMVYSYIQHQDIPVWDLLATRLTKQHCFSIGISPESPSCLKLSLLICTRLEPAFRRGAYYTTLMKLVRRQFVAFEHHLSQGKLHYSFRPGGPEYRKVKSRFESTFSKSIA